MTENNFQLKLGSVAADLFKGATTPLPVADANGRPGWSYSKAAGGGADDKFNYFFYGGTYENMKLKHVKSMFFCGSIDAWSNDIQQVPFFVIYTKMKNDGTDAGLFYHSKHAYVLNLNTELIRPGERCLYYCLQEPLDQFSDARKVAFRTRLDTGTYDPENPVLFMTLHSDSSSTAHSVHVEALGAEMSAFELPPVVGQKTRNVGATHINMKLIV